VLFVKLFWVLCAWCILYAEMKVIKVVAVGNCEESYKILHHPLYYPLCYAEAGILPRIIFLFASCFDFLIVLIRYNEMSDLLCHRAPGSSFDMQ
jgi:hypothetical protein